MKIIRYLDSQEQIHYGAAQGDGSAIELTGELFSGLQSTDRRADVAKLLAPLAPSQILGIGLNYRRHAEETKARIPEFPVLFIKGLNSLQNPGDPIFIADRNASNLQKIFFEEPGVHCHFPIWSRDGRFLYFVKGTPTTDTDIWRIPARGGHPEQITFHHAWVGRYPCRSSAFPSRNR